MLESSINIADYEEIPNPSRFALASRLKHMFNTGKLFDPTQQTESASDEHTNKALTSDGRVCVNVAIKYCLSHHVAPNCSISGDDGKCDGDVHDLNMLEYGDLIEKLESIVTRSIPR